MYLRLTASRHLKFTCPYQPRYQLLTYETPLSCGFRPV